MSSDAAIWLMRWLNFLLLGGLIVYFGKTPLTNLLAEFVKAEEDQMSEADDKLKLSATELEKADAVLADLEKEKAILDADARERAELIVKDIEEHSVKEAELLMKHKETERLLLKEQVLASVHNEFVTDCFGEASKLIKGNIKDEDHKTFNSEAIRMIMGGE